MAVIAVMAGMVMAGPALSAPPSVPAPQPLVYKQPLRDKLFYGLSLLARDPQALAAVATSPDLSRLAAERRARARGAVETCGGDTGCYVRGFDWSDAEVTAAGQALAAALKAHPDATRRLVAALDASGLYPSMPGQDADVVVRAWAQAAATAHHILAVYGGGEKPRGPAIDGPAYDVATPAYGTLVKSAASVLADGLADDSLFFEPTEAFALLLLEINRRDEAARLEPLEAGENKAAVARLKTIKWANYPYTALVVPGYGPETAGVALSAPSLLRVKLAAKRFHDGKAPVIIVSGGYVHPNQTPYNEALEMKKALVQDYGVPAAAILVEPHARHTTTNLRNADRLIYRYGMPMDRKALVVTDLGQSGYITEDRFATRNQEDLGYVPFTALERVSPFDVAYLPTLSALTLDAGDPLDP
ncbi:YdcF family protein [Nitrospirillum sp. BR 11828]|uniref:YdcF family protein n=1 Tax=Nitrospirillum sp. BR 11828 TaxID=3104325 RepID=UPI002ACAB035|nr:YdcF family protein [Nitrospirillum sp. BR 11828]MDZ5647777.1 YdcF family protein [Nitrospirillum sp. BR 11828]